MSFRPRGATLGERAKQDAHRKTVVTLDKDKEPPRRQNQFDFFAQEIGEDEEEKTSPLDVAEVTSENED